MGGKSIAGGESSQNYPDIFSAAAMEIARLNKINDTVPWWIVMISAPGMVFKQVVNVLQLWHAGRWLGEGDRRERRKGREEKNR